MKPCDLPPVVFVQGWLMILAGIHQHLADDALHSAICRTIFVVSANPRFEMNEELASELVSLQLMALAKKSAGSELSEFCQRSLRVLLKDAMLDN